MELVLKSCHFGVGIVLHLSCDCSVNQIHLHSFEVCMIVWLPACAIVRLRFFDQRAGGKYSVTNGSAEWHALDTNDDGWVDMHDDPYTPFYPGDQWVDWVGLNEYHMGQVSTATWHVE